jgi:uncharacterized protein
VSQQIALDNEIIRITNGSKLYGTDHEDSDDDAIAVFIEPPEYVFSYRKIETAKLYDRKATDRAKPGEVDGVSYSLRHIIKLALDGNPSILTALYAPPNFWLTHTPVGAVFMAYGPSFTSMKAAPRFEGYMHNQLQRLTGVKTGHIPNRPELVEKYGYDTKYAMSVARLALQGIEYFETGTIHSPMDEPARDLLTSIRTGEFTYGAVVDKIISLGENLKFAIQDSELPAEPDYDAVYKMSRFVHQTWWNTHGA